jgi:hypothetical protein
MQSHRDDPRQGTVADGRALHGLSGSDASDEPLEEAHRGFAGLQGGEPVEVTDEVPVTKLADVDFPWRHVQELCGAKFTDVAFPWWSMTGGTADPRGPRGPSATADAKGGTITASKNSPESTLFRETGIMISMHVGEYRLPLAGLLTLRQDAERDLRHHQAIVQPRLCVCLMVTQITLKTEGPHGLPCFRPTERRLIRHGRGLIILTDYDRGHAFQSHPLRRAVPVRERTTP